MCPPATDGNLLDRRLALETGFTLASVSAMPKLEKSLFAVSINIIGNRRTSSADGLLQYLLQRGMQLVEFSPRQRVGASPGTHACANQALIRVDVSHAMQEFLIQQRGLDWRLTAMKQLRKLIGTDPGRFRTRPREHARHGLPAVRTVADQQTAVPFLIAAVR